MNVFVLTTGRSGSVTFSRACSHIINYTSGHETRARKWKDRFHYPDNHIEVDHRLTFFLGELDHRWGNDAYYVHLRRDPEATARSWAKRRSPHSLMSLWPRAVIWKPGEYESLEMARLYVQSTIDNIEMFLKDKQWMEFWIDRPDDQERDFWKFWNAILAEGDFENALGEFKVKHNASGGR